MVQATDDHRFIHHTEPQTEWKPRNIRNPHVLDAFSVPERISADGVNRFVYPINECSAKTIFLVFVPCRRIRNVGFGEFG